MQPRNLLAVVPAVLVVLELLGGGVELVEPHPAVSSKVALATATVIIEFLNSYLLDEGS
jgi:hypothetical protein